MITFPRFYAPRLVRIGAVVCLALALSFEMAALIGGGWGQPRRSASGITVRTVAGWDEQELAIADTPNEREGVLRLLRYDDALYKKFRKSGREFELLITHWNPGTMPVDKVAAHTPDACWPGGGWQLRSNLFPHALREAGLSDPGIQYRVYEQGGVATHTAFLHMVDGRPTSYGSLLPVPMWERMAANPLSWFRHKREQFFIRITSREPLVNLLDDPGFRTMLRELAVIGSAH